MTFRFGPGSGCILEIVLGFGIGAGALGAASGNLARFDFSRAGNSGLIAVLRRF